MFGSSTHPSADDPSLCHAMIHHVTILWPITPAASMVARPGRGPGRLSEPPSAKQHSSESANACQHGICRTHRHPAYRGLSIGGFDFLARTAALSVLAA